MYLTVILAELIIASAVLFFIIKADRKICALNNEIIKFIPEFETGLRVTKSIITNIDKGIHLTICLWEKKKKMMVFKMAATTIFSMFLLLSKGKYKKTAMLFNLIMIGKNALDKLSLLACKFL